MKDYLILAGVLLVVVFLFRGQRRRQALAAIGGECPSKEFMAAARYSKEGMEQLKAAGCLR